MLFYKIPKSWINWKIWLESNISIQLYVNFLHDKWDIQALFMHFFNDFIPTRKKT